MKLSDNFTKEEAERSETALKKGIDNSMSISIQINAEYFAKNLLQPLRDKIGKPFLVSSWYRSPALNKAVKGSPTSSHLSGMAIDFTIQGMTAKQTFDVIKEALKDLDFDQLIFEQTWVHLGLKKKGNRKQVFSLRG